MRVRCLIFYARIMADHNIFHISFYLCYVLYCVLCYVLFIYLYMYCIIFHLYYVIYMCVVFLLRGSMLFLIKDYLYVLWVFEKGTKPGKFLYFCASTKSYSLSCDAKMYFYRNRPMKDAHGRQNVSHRFKSWSESIAYIWICPVQNIHLIYMALGSSPS